jgi:hypothetical protein
MTKAIALSLAFAAGISFAAPAVTTTAPKPAPKAPVVAPPATQPGRVARTTDLRDKPANDGAMLRVVPANAAIEVAERQGGWYRVSVEGTAGWMRLSAVRFGAPVAVNAAGGGSSTLRFLQSGRSAVTSGTVTTGVRGLSEEGLSKAEPDYTAVAALDALAVSGDDARSFAGDLPLAAVKVEYVKPPDKKEDKKKSKDQGGGG